ncbi:MAG TPA: cytosine permease [Candidatus Deferrimicrobium sp.]|nr:cytosine permease [Candidatus Deferrimicrobium sp.]
MSNQEVTDDRSGDYASLTIPEEQRKSGLSIFFTTAGWIICLSTMFTGGALVAGLRFSQCFWAGLIGMGILTLFSAPLAAIGGRYGVSTSMLSRYAFGKIGGAAFGLIVAILLGIGWFAYQTAFFGLTMSTLLPHSFFANPIVGSLIGGILMTFTAMYGYKGIAILSFVAVPLIVVLSLFGGIAGIQQSGGWATLLTIMPAKPITLFSGITMVVGNAAMGAVVLSDLTRYAKNGKTGAVSAAGGYMLGGLFCIMAGAAMAVGANIPSIGTTPNLPAVMVAIGLGVGALFILILAQWTTNTANVYSGGVGLGNFLPIRQRILVLSMGLIGTVLAIVNIYAYFIPFLNVLGTILPPIAGVMLADYYVVHQLILKKGYAFGTGTKYAQINWLSIVCAIAGAVIASKLDFFTPSFTGIVIAFVLYSALALLFHAVKLPFTIGEYVEKETGL